MTPKRKYFGSAAHFIGAQSCRFHIATQIGEYVISTVGDYTPGYPKDGDVQEVGYGRTFETMVFKANGPCECGCGMPKIVPSEIDFAGYKDRRAANEGHEKMCQKYECVR